MSKVSTIHDALVSLVGTTLPDYVHIPNPYELENNSQLYLRKGYAVGFGPSEVSRRNVKTQLFERRLFQVFLIREHNVSETRVTDRTDLEKAMIEDKFSVAKAVELDINLTDAIEASYVGDTGLQYITPVNDLEPNTNRNKFISIELTFEVEYLEVLS